MCRQNLVLLAAIFVLISVVTAQEFSIKRGGCITECVPRFGILSAFGAEADILLADTVGPKQYVINGNTFTTGVLRGNPVVIVLTGVSVENAAMVTQLMIDHFNVNHLLLSGIAGGLDPANHIADVVIPNKWAFPLEDYWNGGSTIPSHVEPPATSPVSDCSSRALLPARTPIIRYRPQVAWLEPVCS